MGSQINFYLGPDDLTELAAQISKEVDVVFLKDLSDDGRPKMIESVVPNYGVDPLAVLICRPADVEGIEFRHIPQQNHYAADTERSLAIELTRSFVSKSDFIRSGRVYRCDRFWAEDGTLVTKPVEWVTWAKKVFYQCKKVVKKFDATFYYAGKQALLMREAGCLFKEIDDPRSERYRG